MREKWKALLARIPRLTRRQRLVRNLVCCVLLGALALWALLGERILPPEWMFHRAERASLLPRSETVARFRFGDAFPWDPGDEQTDLFDGADAEHRWFYSHVAGGDRFMVGLRGGWLHIYDRDYANTGRVHAIPREKDAAVFLFNGMSSGKSIKYVGLLIYAEDGAATAEATVKQRSRADGTVATLTGAGPVKDHLCVLVLEREGEPAAPEPDETFEGYHEEYQVQLVLRDGAGSVLCRRAGPVEYDGGWSDEN